VEDKLKHLIKELGDAINETLATSDQIAEVIARIKNEGYDVFLVLEATVGVNRKDEDESDNVVPIDRDSDLEPEFTVNAQDMRFLKSLRISVDDVAA
jgi:uncharacterized protein (UPF0335 family)